LGFLYAVSMLCWNHAMQPLLGTVWICSSGAVWIGSSGYITYCLRWLISTLLSSPGKTCTSFASACLNSLQLQVVLTVVAFGSLSSCGKDLMNGTRAKSKANNTTQQTGCWLYKSLQPTSQPTYIVVTSSLLIRSLLVSLAEFIGSCVQAVPTRFSSLPLHLSI
jgi:hypothetical protein